MSHEAAQRLTGSNQADNGRNDRKEYRNVFDNLRRLCQILDEVWERPDTHDGTTLLPHFDVEDGCVYLLRRP